MAANISFQDAFKKVMNKKVDQEDPVLSKYKKPVTDLDLATLKEKEEQKKRREKEVKKQQGYHKPTKEDEERERELAIVATRGLVTLFNSVSEHQTVKLKENLKEQREQNDRRMDILGLKGDKPGQRDTLYDKIQST